MEVYEVRVGSQTVATQAAGAIAKRIRSDGVVRIRAIGAAAVAKAVNALTIARSYLEVDRLDIVYQSEFMDVKIETGEERTTIIFTAYRKKREGIAPAS